VGIVGYGSIGRETARLARALGMRVLACKRNPERKADTGWSLPETGDPQGSLPEKYYGIAELQAMLKECDYVVLTLALTPATRHIIDAEALRSMKPGAVLVNVARGALVDEPALIEALHSGQIRAAGLDVFEKEPLPADSPLWAMPNVLLTPHIAGLHPAHDAHLISLFTENLQRYLAGQPLLNLVDVAAGY
jgi:phosphoglycerate dehydrogenase-like enzyme